MRRGIDNDIVLAQVRRNSRFLDANLNITLRLPNISEGPLLSRS